MARGESNILYNPPRIKKQTESLWQIRENRGQFFHPAQDVFIGKDGFIALERKEEQMSFQLEGEGTLPGYISQSPFSLTDEGLLWFQGGNLYFKESGRFLEDPYIYPLREEREVYGVYASRDSFYLLWRDEREDYLSCVDRTAPGLGIIDIERYPGTVSFKNKGENSIICHLNGDDAFLTTLTPKGVEGAHLCDKETSAALLFSSLLPPSEQIASGGEDGTYFYLDQAQGVLWFLDLEKGERRLLTIPRDKIPPEQDENDVALCASEGKALLLQKDKVDLFSDKGLLFTKELSERYTQMSFAKDRAILWDQEEYLDLSFTL